MKYFFYPSLVLSVIKVQCLWQKRVKQWCNSGGYKQRARVYPSDRQTLLLNAININYRIARELNLSSVMVFHKLRSLQSLPTAEAKLSCARWQYRISQQNYESYIKYSGIELELARSKVSNKVCGFTFGSTPLHLISKRIKEILTQKHQYNAKYLSWFNDNDDFRK